MSPHLNPFPTLLAYTDSQSDTDTLTTPGEVLDLTAQDKEQPPSGGASELSPATQDITDKEAKAEAAPPEKEEEKKAEENPEPEEESRAEESARDTAEESTRDADAPEDDTASNQSLDLDFATKLMDFKLAESEAGTVDSQGPGQQEPKHACDTCGKSFKFLGTLSRHRKAHGCQEPKEEAAAPSLENDSVGRAAEGPSPSPKAEEKPAESPAVDPTLGTREDSVEKQNEETEGPSDGKGTAEKRGDGGKRPKTDSPKSMASKADKRKKVCSICNKRFWSLQDLTRHMRSHTGMREQTSRPAEAVCTGHWESHWKSGPGATEDWLGGGVILWPGKTGGLKELCPWPRGGTSLYRAVAPSESAFPQPLSPPVLSSVDREGGCLVHGFLEQEEWAYVHLV